MTTTHFEEGMDFIFIICSPLDCQTKQNCLVVETCRILETSVEPDSLFLIKKNLAILLPNIDKNIAVLLYDVLSNVSQCKKDKYGDGCIAVRSNQRVTYSYQSSLIGMLANKYVPKRTKYYLRYDTFIKPHISARFPKEAIIDSETWMDSADLDMSAEKSNKANYGSMNIRHVEENQEIYMLLKAYLETDPIIRYKCQKKEPTVHGEDPEPTAESSDEQEIDSISIKRDHGMSDSQSPTVKRRQRKRRKIDSLYRNSCPEMLLRHKFVIKPDTDERSVFSDSENLENLSSQGKEISLKLSGKDGELKQEVRKHLRQITNLPLIRCPWKIPDLVVFPGRRKKNERPVGGRPQRGQAQGSSGLTQVNQFLK